MLQLYNGGDFVTSFTSLHFSPCLSLSRLQCRCFVSTTTRDLPLPQFTLMDDLIHPQPPSHSLVKHTPSFCILITFPVTLDDSTYIRSCLTNFLQYISLTFLFFSPDCVNHLLIITTNCRVSKSPIDRCVR